MNIHFNGAAQTVTGSQYLLEVNGYQLLLECGLYQGHRKDYYQRNRTFGFNPAKLDAVFDRMPISIIPPTCQIRSNMARTPLSILPAPPPVWRT